MKHKVIHQWYCDFCKRKGGSAFHIKKHELHCTNNPRRECGFCAKVGMSPVTPAQLMITMRVMGFKAVLKEVGNCPACTLAFIRQNVSELNEKHVLDGWYDINGKAITDCHWSTFDYQKAVKAFWEEHGR